MRRIFAVLFVLALFVASGAFKSREWKPGTPISVDVVSVPISKHKVIHDYTIMWRSYLMTRTSIQWSTGTPLKTAVRDAIKFAIEKHEIVLLDADGKVRSGRIYKRERRTRNARIAAISQRRSLVAGATLLAEASEAVHQRSNPGASTRLAPVTPAV